MGPQLEPPVEPADGVDQPTVEQFGETAKVRQGVASEDADERPETPELDIDNGLT